MLIWQIFRKCFGPTVFYPRAELTWDYTSCSIRSTLKGLCIWSLEFVTGIVTDFYFIESLKQVKISPIHRAALSLDWPEITADQTTHTFKWTRLRNGNGKRKGRKQRGFEVQLCLLENTACLYTTWRQVQ